MVDETRVLRLLRSLTDTLAVLRDEQDADEDRRRDPMWLRGVKYSFVVAIEHAIDVAHHLCSAQGWGPPDDNGDAMGVLGRHGVLDERLAGQMRSAVGFRDVLVHDYVRVDDDIVIDQLSDLADLERFVISISGWLDASE